MAYAYKAIDDLLAQGQPKQNIFASEGAPQAGQAGAPQDQGVKTSTEGEVSSEPSSPTQKQASVDAGSPSQADKAAIKANAGKAGQPQAISNVQSQLQARDQQLQNEANKYVQQGRAAQDYSFGKENTEKAIKGDQEQRQNLIGLLGRKNTNQVEEFKPSDVNVADANLINTEAGLRNLVARGQGPQYTQGMAAFDAQALRRSPDFANLMKMIQGQQEDLRKKAQDYAGSKRKEVEDFGAQQLAKAQDEAKGYLGSEAAAIDAANQQEADAANKRLAELRTKGLGRANYQALDDARMLLGRDLRQVDPKLANEIASAKVDPARFASIRDDYAGSDFVSAPEAERFNAIMGLLGQGAVRGESGPLAPVYQYNQKALQNALLDQAKGSLSKKNEKAKAKAEAKAKKAAEAEAARVAQEAEAARAMEEVARKNEADKAASVQLAADEAAKEAKRREVQAQIDEHNQAVQDAWGSGNSGGGTTIPPEVIQSLSAGNTFPMIASALGKRLGFRR